PVGDEVGELSEDLVERHGSGSPASPWASSPPDPPSASGRSGRVESPCGFSGGSASGRADPPTGSPDPKIAASLLGSTGPTLPEGRYRSQASAKSSRS